MTYEALIKVNISDSRDVQLSHIRMGLHDLAARLVSEYGQGRYEVEAWFEECIDIAHEEADSPDV